MAKRRVFVAGHNGLVGSAICRRLEAGDVELLTEGRSTLDLTSQAAVDRYFEDHTVDQVYLAAAKVGGIEANNSFPADYIYQNLAIQNNVIHAAWRHGVSKLAFLGSSCIYPKLADQPISEESLLTGPLEPTNEPYAVAKIAGIRMCQAYFKQYGFNAISLMPTNLYGPGDNFDLQTSHVLPALIRKFHEAKTANLPSVEVWGSGTPKREFLHVDDLADACVFLMETYDRPDIVNIGWGKDISIGELAELISDEVGYQGSIDFNTSKPDGTPRKLLDTSRLESLGWAPKVDLKAGIADTYQWYCRSTG